MLVDQDWESGRKYLRGNGECVAGFLSGEKARRKKNEAYPMLVSFIGNLKIIFLTPIPLHYSTKFLVKVPLSWPVLEGEKEKQICH